MPPPKVLIYGKTTDDSYVPFQTDADGVLQANIAGASDDTLEAINTAIGAKDDTAASADTGTFSLIAITKRVVARLTSIVALFPASIGQKLKTTSMAVTLASNEDLLTYVGGVTEAAPATDTASSGLNGRLQRTAQRLTSLIALIPALGPAAAAASLPVTLANDGVAATLLGGVTETAPSTDTGSSGINGRLQRVAQKLTTIIAGITVSSITLPTTIYNGQKNVTTAGTRVTLASSQAILSGVTIKAKITNTGLIYVGDSSVSSSNGYILSAGDSVFLEIVNLITVNLDSSVNGEGVSYIAT